VVGCMKQICLDMHTHGRLTCRHASRLKCSLWAWKRAALSALLKNCTPEGVPPNITLMRIMQRFLIICNAETRVPTKQYLQIISHVQVEVFLQLVIPLGMLPITDRDVMMLSGLFQDCRLSVSALTLASCQFGVNKLYCTKAGTCSATSGCA